MLFTVLVVDPRSTRRTTVCQALAQQKLRHAEAPSLFQGIASLGRADFTALVVTAGRPASLRGLCRLARKRHPAIRILVMVGEDTDRAAIQNVVGVSMEFVSWDLPPADVAVAVERACRAPAPVDVEPLRTATVQLDVERALADDAAHPPLDDLIHGVLPGDEDDDTLLEGTLEGDSGAALLMGLFAQDATGALTVDMGPAAGTFVFLHGEPVMLQVTDAALVRALRVARKVAPDFALEVPEGLLDGELTRTGVVTAAELLATRQELLRERLRALVAQKEGAWRLVETPVPADVRHAKVNPFGIILEHHKRAMTADRLHVVGMEVERKFMHPGAALGAAAPKLKPFVRGCDVASLVTGHATVEAFTAATGLDLLMGTLVVLTLLDAQLITLQDRPAATAVGRVALRKALRAPLHA